MFIFAIQVLILKFPLNSFDCHINVECAISFGSLKYINKYIYKGHDRTTMQINQNDEIKLYVDARYVAAAEACWRIFHFHLHGRSPAVVRLQVHTEGDHYVLFEDDDNAQFAAERGALRRTTLTAFFEANSDLNELGMLARQYTYAEFPQHFVWNISRKKWTIRKQGFAIGRMYYIPQIGRAHV